jgi:hypothetical protein
MDAMTILSLLAQVPADPAYRITLGGWVIMLLSVGFVTGLLAWCISRVLRESSPQKLHSPLDTETPDTRE